MTQKLGFLLVLSLVCLIAAKDDTLKRWAKGKDVTEATLRKITKSQIFNQDHNFLLRLAYVESKFGEDDFTFRTDYFGGIWQVEESVFRITQTSLSTLFSHYKAINSTFQIDWIEVTWKQLVTPLYSGLAAALYLACVEELEPMPQNVPGQVEYWKKYYRPFGDIYKFKNDSKQLQTEAICRGKMDLCIVLDGSGSIGYIDYQLAKDFVATLISSFTLDYTRIGMVVFSDTPTTIFEISNGKTISQLAEQAKAAYYPDSGTQTDAGIKHATQMFKRSADGEYSGVPKVMTVFTDGKSNAGSDISGAVAGIRDNNIKSISIGIGPLINPNELLQIALGDQRSVFTFQDFTSLQDFLQTITSVACEVAQTPILNTNYDDVLKKQEKRFYHLKIPQEGITVNVTEVQGKTRGYWSRADEAPSEAVHDGVIKNGLNFIPALKKNRAKRDVEEEEDQGENVYISMEGVEEINNYTLYLVEGDKVVGGDGGNGAGINILAKHALFFLVMFHVAFD